MSKYSIGVDIGGTTVATGLINKKGEVLFKAEVPSTSNNREKMFKQVQKSIDNIFSIQDQISIDDITGIGIGVPGKVDIDKGVAVFQNNLPWDNFPLVKRIRNEYEVSTVLMDNDVYMATYAEYQMNNIDKEDTFVYFTISTGISCSIIDKGEFIRGAGFAGEVGFLPSTSSEENFERLEKTAAGPGITKYAKDISGKSDINTKAVFDDFNDGKEYAIQTINKSAAQIARGLYSVICVVDPHKIILGGSVILKNPLFLNLIKKELESYVVSEQLHILSSISVSSLKNNQGIIGAGMKVFD